MTMGQLELPLFETRSTPDNPVPEQARTHPAQMVIQHCGKAGKHVSHTYLADGWLGCPGVPDLRDAASDQRLAAAVREREQIADMEVLTYSCGVKCKFHPPHERDDGRHCAGMQTRRCDQPTEHTHHRWWVIPDAFYWCDGLRGVEYEYLSPSALIQVARRPVEDVELP